MRARSALGCLRTVLFYAIVPLIVCCALGAALAGIFVCAAIATTHFGLSKDASMPIAGLVTFVALGAAIGVAECLDGRSV